MKKLIALVFGLFLFFSPLATEADETEIMPQEEIAEVPVLEQMTKKQLNDFLERKCIWEKLIGVVTRFQLKGIPTRKRKIDRKPYFI